MNRRVIAKAIVTMYVFYSYTRQVLNQALDLHMAPGTDCAISSHMSPTTRINWSVCSTAEDRFQMSEHAGHGISSRTVRFTWYKIC